MGWLYRDGDALAAAVSTDSQIERAPPLPVWHDQMPAVEHQGHLACRQVVLCEIVLVVRVNQERCNAGA